jgi:hypothetical protein
MCRNADKVLMRLNFPRCAGNWLAAPGAVVQKSASLDLLARHPDF